MITFFMALMAHCFGRRALEDYMWVIAFFIGMMEIMFGALLLSEGIK